MTSTEVPKVEMLKGKTTELQTIAEAPRMMELDLHGYHPADIVFNDALDEIVRQAWESGCNSLTLIHGHGRNRGITPGFVNTNTGFFGLCVRRALRADVFRQWTFRTTLYRGHDGSTSIRLKPNPSPTRTQIDSLEEIVARH
jgi:hypothetical protein